jgi:hypothetical protein
VEESRKTEVRERKSRGKQDNKNDVSHSSPPRRTDMREHKGRITSQMPGECVPFWRARLPPHFCENQTCFVCVGVCARCCAGERSAAAAHFPLWHRNQTCAFGGFSILVLQSFRPRETGSAYCQGVWSRERKTRTPCISRWGCLFCVTKNHGGNNPTEKPLQLTARIYF